MHDSHSLTVRDSSVDQMISYCEQDFLKKPQDYKPVVKPSHLQMSPHIDLWATLKA